MEAKCDDSTTATIIQRFYDMGIFPDWWKLEPMKTDAAWQITCATIKKNDANCRGVVLLGLGGESSDLGDSFQAAARHDLVKGFAVGRTIFAEVAQQWLSGVINDDEAVDEMTLRYRNLCDLWDAAQNGAGK